MILAGDIGGTKARLGLFSLAGSRLTLTCTERYESKNFSSLTDIVTAFYKSSNTDPKQIDRACFGIPGPVIDGRVKVTNLPWELSESELSSSLSIPKVKLVNDLVSWAAAVPAMRADGLTKIYTSKIPEPHGPELIVAPGTGLGHSLVYRDDKRKLHYIASEGGHANFAPYNEVQSELMHYLTQTLGHASVESVLSGPGMMNIYKFLVSSGRFEADPLAVDNKTITDKALSGAPGVCSETLNLFIEILGAHASNLMLTMLATGGVYLGGGIPPKIIPLLKGPAFLRGYLKKGKCLDKVEATPVHVIADDKASLLGAASIAQGL